MRLFANLSKVTLNSSRLTLKTFTEKDAAESFRHATAGVARYMSWNPCPSPADYEPIWRAKIAAAIEGADLSLVVRRTPTGEFLGLVGLHPAKDDLLETGIWLKEDAQGQGYGHEAMSTVIEWASAQFKPSGFLWPVVDGNVASRRLAESLGGRIAGQEQRQKPGDVTRTLVLYVIPAVPTTLP